jgi:hypothetical protein
LAEALKIERESYYRLEKNWWTISVGRLMSLRKGLASNPASFGFGQTATVQAPTLIWL